jgi:glucosamine--fructose-6-phosphate aminotransferase (isomerizing)
MCGIVGYIGKRDTVKVLIEGLEKLEYRGYDSAGIAVYNDEKIELHKMNGRIENLAKRVFENRVTGSFGIGHTRWATHGKPSLINAHPHFDCSETFVVVHNGIIENFRELKKDLIKRGHKFKSETDTEVLAHLIEEYYENDLNFAIKAALHEVDGAYALGIISRKEPGVIYAARKGSPLIIGVGEGENFIASDVPAILDKTRKIIFLDDEEVAKITAESIEITTLKNTPVNKEIVTITWDPVSAQKGGYDHFMLKEIYEQPKAILDTIRERLTEDGPLNMEEIGLGEEDIRRVDRIVFIACGTSYHAGLVGKFVFENLTKIPVEVDVASEYRYRNPIVRENDLIIVISQSGETADTLAALRIAKKHGARTLGIVNVLGSTITREGDATLYTHAGPEIGVASTKAFTSQLAAIYLLGLTFARYRNSASNELIKEISKELLALPQKIETILKTEDIIKKCATIYHKCEDFLYLGRNVNFPIALEGALKLKEISYIHAEGYPAGEMKHGPIALIEPSCPSVVLLPKGETYDKMVSNIQEVKAREGKVIAVAQERDDKVLNVADYVFLIPETIEILSPILNIIPLQLLSYHIACLRGCDVDKPRNLAKSVTVE